MQILTKFLIVCALAAAITPFSSRGADTDAQMKAREALHQKISELDSQPAAPSKAPQKTEAPAPAATKPADTSPPPTPAPAAVAPAAATAPAAAAITEPPPAPAPVKTTQPKPAAAPSGQVTASRPDSERIAKARAALQEKMKELDTQPTLASQPPVFHTPEINSANQPTVTANTISATEPLPTPPPVNRPAVDQSKKPGKTKPQPESLPMFALPKGPPPPVSAEKVQKLDSLLRQYEADQITPEQYHQERAKILAGQ